MDKILIVYDHMFFYHLAREVLSECHEFAVVGDSCGAEQAMDMVDELKPNMILMEVEMDEINGLEAIRLARHLDARVVLTMVEGEKEYSGLALKWMH